MTAETLKPFITPSSAVGNFPAMQSSASRSERKTKLISIGLSVAALALAIILLTLTIWQGTRLNNLESELTNMQRLVDKLYERLGMDYLEQVEDFEEEYKRALLEEPNKLHDSDLLGEDDEDEDSDDDDDDSMNDPDSWDYNDESSDNDYEYTDVTPTSNFSKSVAEPSNEETDGSNASNDDNVFNDFKNYNDSKKKRDRKSRSIAELRNDIQSYGSTLPLQMDSTQLNKTKELAPKELGESSKPSMHHSRHFVAEQSEKRRVSSPLRQRTARRRKLPIMKSGESLISAKTATAGASMSLTATPAAHFHLHRKVPHHNAPLRPEGYRGDMYIGHASASSDNSWQQYFSVDNGILTVHEPGLYYVYAQICYNNTHDQNGFIIFHGLKPFLQCLNTVPTNMPQKVHTCHTSGLIQLQEQESIHLRDIHGDRNVMLRDSNNRSYFGLIKV